jgi:hypothetical protein
MTDFAPIIEQPNEHGYLDANALEAVGKSATAGADISLIADPSRDPMPSPDDAKRMREQEWFGTLKRSLGGRAFTDFVLGTPPTDDRDNSMMSLIGGIVDFIYGHPFNGTPERAFACCIDAIEQLSPDKGGAPRDWIAWTWEKIGYCWVRRVARDLDKPAPLAVQAAERVAAGTPLSLKELAIKVREWCPAPELHDADSDAAQEIVKSLAIVCVRGNDYHILQPSGYYRPIGRNLEHLPRLLMNAGWSDHLPLKYESKDGDKWFSTTDLLRTLPILDVDQVDGRAGLGGDIVADVDGENPRYVRALYSLRTDITPEFSEEVRAWMLAQAGEDQIENYEKWIAYALDFDRPICMLALSGPRDVGKSFMVLGLADCLKSYQEPAKGKIIFDDFPEQLLRTPFVEIAETLPSGGFGGKARDRLRELIGGSSFSVNVKNKPQVVIQSPLRFIATMNNDEPLRELGDADATSNDKNAIIQRTLGIRVREEAHELLVAKGGRDYTDSWVSNGRPKGESRLLLAKHFLWLYHQRIERWRPGSRLAVEGENYKTGGMVEKAIEKTDARYSVAAAVCGMIEAAAKQQPVLGLWIGDQIAVTAHGVYSYLERGNRRQDLTPRQVGSLLSTMATARQGHAHTDSTGTPHKGSWHELHLDVLYEIAQETGVPCATIAARIALLEQPNALPQA